MSTFNPPSAALFSTSAYSTSATDAVTFDSSRGYSLVASDTGGASGVFRNRFHGKAVPSGGSWSATFAMRGAASSASGPDNVRYCAALLKQSTGQILHIGVNNAGGNPYLLVEYYSDINTRSSAPYGNPIRGDQVEWFQISYDGTNYTFSFSADEGQTWQTLSTVAAASYFTADHIGVNISTDGPLNTVNTAGSISTLPPTMNAYYYSDPDYADTGGGTGAPTGTITTSLPTLSQVADGFTPPRGTMNVTERPDYMNAADATPTNSSTTGWSVNPPDPGVSSWNNIWSDGNRLVTSLDGYGNGLITQAYHTGNLVEYEAFEAAFNGGEGGSQGPYYTGVPAVGANSEAFIWVLSNPLCIDGIAFAADTGCGAGGTWQFCGSIDGQTWFVLQTFNWAYSAGGWHDGVGYGLTVASTNKIAWNHYALFCTNNSGVNFPGRVCHGIDFRIPQTSPVQDQHIGTLSVSSGITYGNAQTIDKLFDGLRYNGFPTAAPDIISLSGSNVAGQYIQFNFEYKAINVFQFRLNLGGTFYASFDYGIWQWYGSHDGSTYTAVGPTIALKGGGAVDPVFQVGGFGDHYQFLRLQYVSGGTTIFEGPEEIYFDAESLPLNALVAKENPDTASFRGYAGAYGIQGDLAASEATDTMTATGFTADIGTMNVSEAPDKFAAIGYMPVRGTLAATEATDKAAVQVTVPGTGGTMAASESVDTMQATGYTPLSGTLAATENADRAVFRGAGLITPTTTRQTFFVT